MHGGKILANFVVTCTFLVNLFVTFCYDVFAVRTQSCDCCISMATAHTKVLLGIDSSQQAENAFDCKLPLNVHGVYSQIASVLLLNCWGFRIFVRLFIQTLLLGLNCRVVEYSEICFVACTLADILPTSSETDVALLLDTSQVQWG